MSNWRGYYWACFRRAAWRTPDIADLYGGIFVAIALGLVPYLMGYEVIINLPWWAQFLSGIGLVFLVRLALAPYWIYQEQKSQIEDLRDKLEGPPEYASLGYENFRISMNRVDDGNADVQMGVVLRNRNPFAVKYNAIVSVIANGKPSAPAEIQLSGVIPANDKQTLFGNSVLDVIPDTPTGKTPAFVLALRYDVHYYRAPDGITGRNTGKTVTAKCWHSTKIPPEGVDAEEISVDVFFGDEVEK